MGKVYGYCRVALANDDELKERLNQVYDYCKNNGLELHKCFYDNGISGLTLDRDGLKSLLDVLQEGDIVVVRNIASLSRNAQQCMKIIESISEAGVTLIIMDLEKENKMEKKIIELTKVTNVGTCLLCCEREATVKVRVNRVKYNDNVIGFDVCDECLAQMQSDIQRICE